ncbi:sensor histidine kinase [Bacillus sp. MRMR6]|uniref:sensor histidine kinase n=1 Tax=Bacillus sp. MRMR6 TaxID=1928617 RepID=UPI000950DB16|nr:ATP-binding protein [Bacillus sp. MRMR6]OLS40479.1 two-component sensor histidine kinase [Bacillus sp. MRMR6]
MEISPEKQQIRSYIIEEQEEEIKRISLDLHEGVGQNLYSILTGLQFVESSTNQPHLKDYLYGMTQLIEKTIQEIRLLSVELHPPSLTTLGLLPALKSYSKLYTSTFGILIDLKSSGEVKLISEKASISVFRVCQEALTNIAKYADTCNVSMDIHWNETELKISIDDFGKGFQPEEIGSYTLGISAMKERMLLAGGTCVISSKIDEGTSILISLPI